MEILKYFGGDCTVQELVIKGAIYFHIYNCLSRKSTFINPEDFVTSRPSPFWINRESHMHEELSKDEILKIAAPMNIIVCLLNPEKSSLETLLVTREWYGGKSLSIVPPRNRIRVYEEILRRYNQMPQGQKGRLMNRILQRTRQ